MFNHCVIELYPHHLLHFDVFKLYVANCNGHDFAIHQIIYMAHLVQSMTHLTWSSTIKEFSKSPPGCICATKPISLPTPSADILKMKTSNLKFALGSNSPWCNHNDFYNSIEGCCQCIHPSKDSWKKQQGYKHLENSIEQTCIGFVPIVSPLEAQGYHCCYHWIDVLSRNICSCSRELWIFLDRMSNLLPLQSTFSLFHNLFTFTICKVEMHTKVNHFSWNGLKSMDNIINLTFAIINIQWKQITKFTFKQGNKRT
jgi:hypothetical protein